MEVSLTVPLSQMDAITKTTSAMASRELADLKRRRDVLQEQALNIAAELPLLQAKIEALEPHAPAPPAASAVEAKS